MIKTNLAVLMAERGLKIADIYEATGISKTTLMAISENTGKGIQYETMDKLCNYFNIDPGDFFIYSPFRISVNWFDDYKGLLDAPDEENDLTDVDISIESNNGVDNFLFNFVISPKDDQRIPLQYRNKIDFGISMGNWAYRQNENSLDFMKDFINKLPVQFLSDFQQKIDNKIKQNIDYLVFNKIPFDNPFSNEGRELEIDADKEYKIYLDYSFDDQPFLKSKILSMKTKKMDLPF